MNIKYISKCAEKDIRGKKILVRVDLNIKDESEQFRLDAIIPTLLFLLAKGAKKIIIVSHRGRPVSAKRTISNFQFPISKNREKISLEIFAPMIAERTGETVDFVSANRIAALVREVENSGARIALVENIRFFEGEEANNSGFAKVLASCAEMYVNDAFASSHRAHASISAITKFLPSYAGILFEREIRHLDAAMVRPKHPFVLIVGGTKISDKLGVLKNFADVADSILLGGGAANTFFAAHGFPVGMSIYDADEISSVKKFLGKNNFLFPVDVLVSEEKILDIGPETSIRYAGKIQSARTVIWGGPMGLYEKKGFERGTKAMWKAILALAEKDPRSRIVVGGGETIASLRLLKIKNNMLKNNIFLSTGGGAMLEYLSGKKLPGVEALKKQKDRK